MSTYRDSVRERRELLPHQADFIEQALSEEKRFLLQSDVGLGTSFTAAHLIKRVVTGDPSARVLVLTPKPLAMQMQSELAELDVAADLVDRYRYREFQDAELSGQSIWSPGIVAILSLDFAKQRDIAGSLASVSWNLLIVKEAQQLYGLKQDLVRRLIATSPDARVILLTNGGDEKVPLLSDKHFTKVHWRTSEVTDEAGRPLFVEMPTKLEVIEFHESAAEQQLRDTVQEIISLLKTSDTSASPIGNVLVRSLASSSQAAVEEKLRCLRNRLAHGLMDFSADAEDMEHLDSDEHALLLGGDREQLLDSINKALEQLESISTDSKLDGFVQRFLNVRSESAAPICILTEYRATLFYLEAQLEDIGILPLVFHSGMSYDERAQTLRYFKETNGTLLATNAGMQGLSLAEVGSLFLYDVPWDPTMLQQIYGRFQRLGRKVPLTVYLLSDSKTSNVSSRLIERLKELMQ